MTTVIAVEPSRRIAQLESDVANLRACVDGLAALLDESLIWDRHGKPPRWLRLDPSRMADLDDEEGA